MALLEEIQLKSSQEEQQARNRCCSLPPAQLEYTTQRQQTAMSNLTHTRTTDTVCMENTHTLSSHMILYNNCTKWGKKHQKCPLIRMKLIFGGELMCYIIICISIITLRRPNVYPYINNKYNELPNLSYRENFNQCHQLDQGCMKLMLYLPFRYSTA